MLTVHAGSHLAGLLDTATGGGNFVFSYAHTAQADQAVSLTMPVRVESYRSEPGALHPIFDMNLPEGYLRNWLAKAVPDFDDLKLLEITGASQLGRLQYCSNGSELPTLPEFSVKDILACHGADDLFQDLLAMYAMSSGVSGVQPKVLIHDPGNMKLSPDHKMSIRAATHIVKTWDAQYPHLAWNEHFCLLAAQAAGLRTPYWSVSENGLFLVVERFDLTPDGHYLGLEDFCVLAGMTQRGKYSGSYEQLAKTLRLFCVPDAMQEALATLFRMIVFNVAIRNGDAHRKNFCLTYATPESRRGSLAPAFDLITTTAYLPRDAMALTLGGSKAWPARRKLLLFGQQHCALSNGEAENIFSEVVQGVADIRPELESSGREIDGFADVGAAMVRAWADGLRWLASE